MMKYVHSLNKKIQISVGSNFVNYIKTIQHGLIGSYILPEASGHDSDTLGAPSHSPPRTRSSHQS